MGRLDEWAQINGEYQTDLAIHSVDVTEKHKGTPPLTRMNPNKKIMIPWTSKYLLRRCFRYMFLENVYPRHSMYGVFTYIYPLKTTQMLVNIPYIEHLGTIH